jgi:hypothetical protein
MTSKTLTHLIIAVALAASAVASLEFAPSLASAPVASDVSLRAGAVPSGGALVLLLPVADRFVASSTGPRLAPGRIVHIAP